MFRKVGLFVLSLIAAASVLAGCSGQDNGGHGGGHSPSAPPSAPSAQAQRNDADIAFATQMIPHHQQAVEMAKLTEGRTGNPKVRGLAAQVQQAQDPEIQLMTGWLRAWGAPLPEAGRDSGHGGHGSMPGMMSEADMARLTNAKDAAFDRAWLELMIQHHRGAIDMARSEQANGLNPEAKALAQRIADSQQAEIDVMTGLLAN